MQKKEGTYGLFTAISMIVGIVIGSGIFFKSDDILHFTGGSIALGMLAFCIGAFGIIFGSLTLTELSMRTEKSGGAVAYFEDFISSKVASGFGWFQTFIYFPTLTVILSWVAGIYTCILFGIENSLTNQVLLGFSYLLFFFFMNILSVKSGGIFQNLTAIIKLIPLLVIAVLGIFWNAPYPNIEAGMELVQVSEVGFGWLAALVPLAFSFDGWIVATSITGEVKNPKRNMTLALILGPLLVLVVYLLFFLGLNRMLGPEYILTAKDSAIHKAGELILGTYGTKILLSFVLISVLGVVNGVVLGGLRMPQALAEKNMIPKADHLKKIHSKWKLSLSSAALFLLVCIFWYVIHYATQKTNALVGGDISEISIVFSYTCYIILYVKVFLLKKTGEVTSIFKGIICPVFGILGAGIIFVGGFISNPVYVSFFILFCFLVTVLGYFVYQKLPSSGKAE